MVVAVEFSKVYKSNFLTGNPVWDRRSLGFHIAVPMGQTGLGCFHENKNLATWVMKVGKFTVGDNPKIHQKSQKTFLKNIKYLKICDALFFLSETSDGRDASHDQAPQQAKKTHTPHHPITHTRSPQKRESPIPRIRRHKNMTEIYQEIQPVQ